MNLKIKRKRFTETIRNTKTNMYTDSQLNRHASRKTTNGEKTNESSLLNKQTKKDKQTPLPQHTPLWIRRVKETIG